MRISVVTVCYNAVDLIEDTICSVLKQSYSDIEYIIIDGGSTDGTIDTITKYEERIEKWISEPDKGIYDAMNKGINASSGDYIIFLNVGDAFCTSHIIQNVVNHLLNDQKGHDIVYGDMIYKYAFGNKYVSSKPLNKIRYDMVFSHQSVFVRTEIMKERKFNLHYKLAADYDFLLWAYFSGFSFGRMDIPVSIVDATGGATNNNFVKSRRESFEIQCSYGGNRLLCYLWFLWTIVHFKFVVMIKKYFPKTLLNWLISIHNG